MTEMYKLAWTPGVMDSPHRWALAVEQTNYFQVQSNILQAVNDIVDKICVHNQNVLVHCTDGWDRTAQLSALAQLLLDGRYRTIKGFQVLVEKDWLSFGHMFERRMGHHSRDFKDDQRSPIFIQFLDLVRMILVQMPAMFEFNAHMLAFIAHEIYTCKFGTFLCNSQRERVNYNLSEKTVSMWTHINHYAEEFTNPFYIAPPAGEQPLRIPRIPTTNTFELSVWKALFMKYSPFISTSGGNPTQSSNETYREQLMRDQRALNVNLTELLAKSQALLEKLKLSERKAQPDESFVDIGAVEKEEEPSREEKQSRSDEMVLPNGVVVKDSYIP